MQAGNSRFLERRMQWEEGAGKIFQLQIWALVVPHLAHLQPGTNTVVRKLVGPALLHPKNFMSHQEWGVIPGQGVKPLSFSCFESKTITQQHPKPGETSLGVRETVRVSSCSSRMGFTSNALGKLHLVPSIITHH